MDRGHWLLAVAERAGLRYAGEDVIEPGIPVVDAWARMVERCGVPENDLARHIATHFRLAVADLASAAPQALKLVPDRAVEVLLGSVDEAAGSGLSVVEEAEAETLAVHEIEAAPVVKLTNLILQDAIEQGASDLRVSEAGDGTAAMKLLGERGQYDRHLPQQSCFWILFGRERFNGAIVRTVGSGGCRC